MSIQPAATRKPAVRIIFVTGTDTGVGKTILTALLVRHLRRSGCNVAAIKPFCSGGREDAELLFAMQDGALTLDEINPYFFAEPLAPLLSARLHDRKIPLRLALEHIERIATQLASRSLTSKKLRGSKNALSQSNVLLIEGAGGLLAPLGESPPVYSSREIIAKLNCEVIIAARNRLGSINHSMLTLRNLHCEKPSVTKTKIVMMNHQHLDSSSLTNPQIMAELSGSNAVFLIPFLKGDLSKMEGLMSAEKKIKKTLALILGP